MQRLKVRSNPLQRVLTQIWTEEDGVLSFEWTLLLTLLTLGIVSGLSAARDAIIDELGDIAQAAGALDQSFTFPALTFTFGGDDDDDDDDGDGTFTTAGSSFTDDAMVYTDCARTSAPNSSDSAAEFLDSDS